MKKVNNDNSPAKTLGQLKTITFLVKNAYGREVKTVESVIVNRLHFSNCAIISFYSLIDKVLSSSQKILKYLNLSFISYAYCVINSYKMEDKRDWRDENQYKRKKRKLTLNQT